MALGPGRVSVRTVIIAACETISGGVIVVCLVKLMQFFHELRRWNKR